MKHFINRITPLLCLLMFAGCNDDNGGGTALTPTPTPPQSVNMTVSSKHLHFTWFPGTNVDHYRILVNPDGISGFTADPNASNIANNATSYSLEIPVHKTNWLAAQYIVEACTANAEFCVSSPNQTVALVDSIAATVYVKASNTDSNDHFGYSVALSGDGNTLAVGASQENSAATGTNGDQVDNSTAASGAVYLFTRNGSTWTQQAYVKASNTEISDQFGISVALSHSGHMLAVGAYEEDSAATGTIPYDDIGDQADNTASGSGAVYLFVYNSGLYNPWIQRSYIKASNTEGGDHFGYSVALSGDGETLAVGAYGEDSATTGINGDQMNNTVSDSGAVYLYLIGPTVLQRAYIKASNTEGGDHFGYSIALSGDGKTLAVGANREGSASTGIDGNQTDNTANDSGAVYLFTRSGSWLQQTWAQQTYIKAFNTRAGDHFGHSIALSGDGKTLAVGANGEGSASTGINGNQADKTADGSGAAYLFIRSDTTWTQQAYVKASNTEEADYFGSSVALSGDGNTFAVGANGEDSTDTGINGDQGSNAASFSGAVYLY